MASIDDRWWSEVKQPDGSKVKRQTNRYGKGLRWCVRWYEPDGRERRQSFARKVDADAHASTVEADKLRGNYIDPQAGKEPFGKYAASWLAEQTTDPLTRQNIGDRLRRYVEPYALHRTELRRIRPTTIQTWLRALDGTDLAESTKLTVFAHVVTILNAAVANELIAKNHARSDAVRKPKPDARKIVPWSREWVMGMHAELGDADRVLVTLGAGLGLRQGELFGLSPDDVDFLRGWVTVQRQVKIVGNRLVFALPKGRKIRKVPLPASVRDELAAHLAARPATAVTLPWEESTGKPTTATLAVTTSRGKALNRDDFNRYVWRPALDRAGIPRGRENGMHALRHYYASVLLDAGESIKALSEYLGHSSATITLDIYAHVMPASEDRTRKAIDSAWRGPSAARQVAEGGDTRANP